MHGEDSVKIVSAQQAKVVKNYRNIKEKLHKTNSAIWFNKVCKLEQLSPKYIQIKINGNNKQCNNTKSAAVRYRLLQEIEFYSRKKLF
jgi:hypothetical protein